MPVIAAKPTSSRRWTVTDDKGVTKFRMGSHAGRAIDEVPLRYLQWLLNEAEIRPGCDEALMIRKAAGEVGSIVRSGMDDWATVQVGHRSFNIPPGVARLFDEELDRLRLLYKTDAQAFEAMIASSSTTPLESLGY